MTAPATTRAPVALSAPSWPGAEALPPWLLPAGAAVLGLVGFAAFWALVVWLIGAMGWRRLAARFPAEGPAEGQRFGMQSARVGLSTYNGAVSVWLGEGGVRLATWGPFAIGHPPILIPWDALEAIEPGGLFGGVRLRLAGSETVALHGAAARQLAAWTQGGPIPHAMPGPAGERSRGRRV